MSCARNFALALVVGLFADIFYIVLKFQYDLF